MQSYFYNHILCDIDEYITNFKMMSIQIILQNFHILMIQSNVRTAFWNMFDVNFITSLNLSLVQKLIEKYVK